MSVRILVIEDDIDIREAVTTGLRKEGMAVDAAPNLAAARGHLAVNRYNAGAVVTGGSNNNANGTSSVVSGGSSGTVGGNFDWLAGTLFEDN